jgi:hypothetical protein
MFELRHCDQECIQRLSQPTLVLIRKVTTLLVHDLYLKPLSTSPYSYLLFVQASPCSIRKMISVASISLAQLAALAGTSYCIVLAIRRIYFSPISHFPGPKLAAATLWYQFYYDVVLGGQYVWKIRDLHKKYGPIVRISPFELHVSDPSFVDELYPGPGSHKRDRWEWAMKGIGVPGATLVTTEHDVHKIRRAALNPFFSKGMIRKLQPLIDAKVDQLIERFEDFKKSKGVVVVNHAFAALTNGKYEVRQVCARQLTNNKSADIASEFAFGNCLDRIRHPTFDPTFHDNCVAGLDLNHLMIQFPFIMKFLESLPDSIALRTDPAYAMFLTEKRVCI